MIPYYYGCLIIGPSGSGKSTLCKGLSQMMGQMKRKHILINLDFANEVSGSEYQVDCNELISLEDVMKEFGLGPNGGLLYCVRFLNDNLEWLVMKLLEYKDHFLIFDFPGQIELYLQNDHLKQLIGQLLKPKQVQLSLVAVELFDCMNCYNDYSYLSQCLMSLVSQINLELPHISVLNKLDLMKQFGSPPMSLIYYLEANNLAYMLDLGLKDKVLKDMQEHDADSKTQRFDKKYKRMTYQLAELIDNFNNVSFMPLYVHNKELIVRLLLQIDKANGYYYLEKLDDLYKSIQAEYAQEEILSCELMTQLEEELFDD